MELQVYNIEGNETGKTVSLSEQIYAIEPNDHAIYLTVKQHLANKRQGTHKAKERAEITGSTRKLKKQKGTGTARAGSIKSPLFRGGGRIFGPRPRNYGFKLNRKVKDLARKSALTYKVKEEKLTILEDFSMEAPKTKDFLKILNNLSAQDSRSLVILPEDNKNIYLASRNLKKTKVMPFSQLNVYDILNADRLFLLEGSLSKIETLLN